MALELGDLFGQGTVSDPIKIKVLFPGGLHEDFRPHIARVQEDEGALLLYHAEQHNENTVRLRLYACFPEGGWLGFVIEEGVLPPDPASVGFRPPAKS